MRNGEGWEAGVCANLLAQEEAKRTGRYYRSLRAMSAMLLNEFLKDHRMVEEQDRRLEKQESIIAQQQKDFRSTIAQQQKQIKALTVQLQHMSDRLEPNHAASKLANNR